MSVALSIGRWLFQRARWVGYRSYYRLAAANYSRQWVSTPKRTPGGWVWSYDLYNRHGTDEMLAELHDTCGPGAVIYDIGANVGLYSLALAAGASDRQLVAFEPSPRIRAQLQANRERNALDDQLEVANCGVGDRDCRETFYLSSYPELSAFDPESASRWEASVAETVEVPIRRVDTIVDSYPVPDAVKIDVEGTAPAVLRGARETLDTHQPTLFIEIHEEGLSADTTGELRDILATVDYTITERDGYWRCEPRV